MTAFIAEGTGGESIGGEAADTLSPSLSSKTTVIPNAAKRNEESLYYRLFILCALQEFSSLNHWQIVVIFYFLSGLVFSLSVSSSILSTTFISGFKTERVLSNFTPLIGCFSLSKSLG